MKRHHELYWAALTGDFDSAPQSLDEVNELQKRAWDEDSFMVLSCHDERLDDDDRIDLCRIAERLFRYRRHRSR